MQRYVSLTAKMEDHVWHLIDVPAPLVGVETHVHKVSINNTHSLVIIHGGIVFLEILLG